MPPVKPWFSVEPIYLRYGWDTTGAPFKQTAEDGSVIFTPLFENLVIYGRRIRSTYAEDWPMEARALERGRVMGEWFSVACPDGELGTNPLQACEEITAEEFSAAYQRGWEPL